MDLQKNKKENKKYLLNLQKMSDDLIKLNSVIRDQHEKILDQNDQLNKIYRSRMWHILSLAKNCGEFAKHQLKKYIPINIRKKIKSIIKSYLNQTSHNVIEQDCLNEFKIWNESRPDKSYDIINFSVINWNFRFQRPQQLATEISKNKNRVFYIENSFLSHHQNIPSYAPIKINKIDNNLYSVNFSATRDLFIYQDTPSKKDKKIIIDSLKTLIKTAKITNPIAKIDHPFWGSILEELKMPIIYDCMDNHQGFVENGAHLVNLEKELFRKSDITLVTSHFLQKIAQKNKVKNLTLIPNACDYKHFSQSLESLKLIPKDIREIPKPIIGYYGAIAEWFDTSLLENIAQEHNKKSIVLIGKVTNDKVEKLSKKYKNIYLLGEKSYQDLPLYLNQFDVCIIPFIINDLIKATHPVKIYEYLAAGKPIVTTKMPEIKDLEKDIFYSSTEDFSKNINNALKQKNKNILTRQKIAKNNTWDKRSDQLLNTISSTLFPKVSIIILSYNHPDLMELTIESVLHRSFYPNMEIIVVDNASNQETVTLLKKYIKFKNVKLIFNKVNYGFAKGNNIGLKKSTGDYIILLNNDVIVTPGWISRLLFYTKKDNIGLVGPVTNSIGNEAKIDIDYNFNNIEDIEKKALSYTSKHWGYILELRNIAAFCWMMSRKTYKKIGGLDENFGRGMFEDDDYCRRVLKNNQKILISDDVFIHHFGGASFKQIQSEEYQKLFNDNKKIFEKKWGKWQPHQYRK